MSEIQLNSDLDQSFDCLSIKMTANKDKCNSKPKRKNSEKRKEKSRTAARERRSQESKIFDQMEALLPIPANNINHLDKASLIRLAINHLKIRKVIEPMKSISKFESESESHIEDYSAVKALNGFMLVLSREGDMVYLSEDVDKYLGLAQIDLIGQSIYDYSHPCDHNDIKDILALKNFNNSSDINSNRNNLDPICSSFFVRMKCILTNKGRNLNLKSANYKVIHCSGHLKCMTDSGAGITGGSVDSVSQNRSYFMTTICEPIDQPMIIEKPLNTSVFISRHSMNMKYTLIDDSINQFLGYDSKELIGKSLFNFIHALDLQLLEKFFKTLFSKGQSESNYYRFLAKSGGYLWILTQATVTTDSQSSQPQSVICVNHVIGGVINKSEIISEEQCFEETVEKSLQSSEVNTISVEPSTRAQPSFVSSTKTVFAPKTADMDRGFLVFDKANHMTYLSDPEDLTHLAPEAGDDVCVPFGLLNNFNEINFFDEVFLNNSSNPNLLTGEEKLKLNDESLQNICINDININSNIDDLNVFIKGKDESLNAKNNDKNFAQNLIKSYPNFRHNDSVDDSPLPNNDPFLSYHEELFSSSPSTDSSDPYSSDTNSPLNMSSPILSQTSNFFCKSPAEEVSKLNINEKNDLIDDKVLEMRAPYIPFDEDFPLLLDNDLQMTYSNTNIDEFINFDNISAEKNVNSYEMNNSSLELESPVPLRTNCLEALLQSKDCLQKNRKFNSKQNLINYVNKSDNNSKNLKTKTNSTLNKVQFVNNNVNQIYTSYKNNSMTTNDMNSTDRHTYAMNVKKSAKNRLNKSSDLLKSATKRSYSTEQPEILYTICPNDVLPNERPVNCLSNGTQIQKRFKLNNNNDLNKGNSVLMNLLVNGEDVTNGYSKYSNTDRSHHSSNLCTNNSQMFSNSHKNYNHMIFDGQDIR